MFVIIKLKNGRNTQRLWLNYGKCLSTLAEIFEFNEFNRYLN